MTRTASFQILADVPISRDAVYKTLGLAWRDTVAERQTMQSLLPICGKYQSNKTKFFRVKPMHLISDDE